MGTKMGQENRNKLLNTHIEAVRRKIDKQRQIVSYHEAGHAVLATFLGFIVHRVSIVPDSSVLGRCHRDALNYRTLDETTARTSAINEILICYAGHAAESLVHRHHAPHSIDRIAREGGRFDHKNAWALLPMILGELDSDATYRERETHLRLCRSYLNYQVTRAYKLVRSEPLKTAIIALANELLGWEELTGEEAREVMEKALQSRETHLQTIHSLACLQNPASQSQRLDNRSVVAECPFDDLPSHTR